MPFTISPSPRRGACRAAVCLLALYAVTATPGVRADALPVATFTARYLDGGYVESRFPAIVEARRASALGFESSGRIAEVTVDTGDRVEAGALLARLDTRALQAQYAAATAQAQAGEARAQLASTTLTREARLVDEGHVSAQRLEELAAESRAASAVSAAARADADALQVRIDLARIEAPFAGVISERLADEGAITAAGAPVLHLVEDRALELRAGLPYAVAQRLEVGVSYLADAGERLVQARFRAATGVVDARRRSVLTVFDLPPESGVRSGETVELRLPTAIETRGFWAPITALTEGRRGLWAVYALATSASGDYILESHPVSVERLESERAFLTGAVAEGTELVAAGVHRVVPGQQVRPAAER